eukprot:2254907-Amphidinium_carterae.1
MSKTVYTNVRLVWPRRRRREFFEAGPLPWQPNRRPAQHTRVAATVPSHPHSTSAAQRASIVASRGCLNI